MHSRPSPLSPLSALGRSEDSLRCHWSLPPWHRQARRTARGSRGGPARHRTQLGTLTHDATAPRPLPEPYKHQYHTVRTGSRTDTVSILQSLTLPHPIEKPAFCVAPVMADIDPPVDDLFAGMKRKSKKGSKKAVNLDELDVDASAPAAPSNDATSISGSGAAAVDLAAAPTPADAGGSDGELDFSSLKRKSKKKSVRIDSDVEDAADLEAAKPKSRKSVDKLGNEVDDEPVDNQVSAEVTAVDASGLDEFADLKKKRKKSSKKAFDLDAFEKELAEAEAQQDGGDEQPKSILKKSTPAGSDDEGDVDEDDEVVEGEDPFGKEDHDDSRASKAEAAATAKAWLNEDRDYHYTEVRVSRTASLSFSSVCPTDPPFRVPLARAAPRPLLFAAVPVAPFVVRRFAQEEVHDPAPATVPRRLEAVRLCQHRRHLQAHAPSAGARHSVPVCRTRNQRFRRWCRPARHQGSFPAE